jgi:predicted DNA-binding protein
MNAMETATLYLPADLRGLLKEAARRTGRPEAVIVRDALRSYLILI